MKGSAAEREEEAWSPLTPERLLATVALLNGRSAERYDDMLDMVGCRGVESESRSLFVLYEDRPVKLLSVPLRCGGDIGGTREGSGEATAAALEVLARAARSETAPSESTLFRLSPSPLVFALEDATERIDMASGDCGRLARLLFVVVCPLLLAFALPLTSSGLSSAIPRPMIPAPPPFEPLLRGTPPGVVGK